MNNTIKSTLALGLVVAAAVLPTSPAEAEIHSKSKTAGSHGSLVIFRSRRRHRVTHSFFTPTMQEARISMSSSSKALVYQSLMLRIRLASSW